MSRPEPTPVDVFSSLIRLQEVRAYAYRTAVASGRLGAPAQLMAARFLEHSKARGAALRTDLEALGGGLDGPVPLVLDGAPLVRDLAEAPDQEALLRVLARLERVAVDTCARAHGRLEEPDLIATVASVMGGHAQQLAALRAAVGEEPV